MSFHTATQIQQEYTISNLAKNHHKRLLYFVLNKVRNEDDAHDIVQSTFVEAIKSINNFRYESKPETWLTGIALNLIKNHFYQQKNKPVYYIEDDSSILEQCIDDKTPFHILAQKQLTTSMDDVFNAMPSDMRKTAEQVLINNVKYKTASIVDKIPIGTVRSRVYRARNLLKTIKDNYLL
jgi:RNA polymerase sigma-70 factor (ECF subfamily)